MALIPGQAGNNPLRGSPGAKWRGETNMAKAVYRSASENAELLSAPAGVEAAGARRPLNGPRQKRISASPSD